MTKKKNRKLRKMKMTRCDHNNDVDIDIDINSPPTSIIRNPPPTSIIHNPLLIIRNPPPTSIVSNPLPVVCSPPINCSIFFEDDIVVCEILSRLPVKSLMRFKSVCKHWRSLIQHDPHFHDLHFAKSGTRPGLLYLMPLGNCSHSYFGLRAILKSVDLFEGRTVIRSISRRSQTKSFHFNCVLKPVKGLVCFLKENPYGVCIYNPGTIEITEVIKSTEAEQHSSKEAYLKPTYGFGFDPATKQHKVICVRKGYRPTPFVACEILSVGHNKWRRIDEVPHYELKSDPVYVNGSIYWSNKSRIEHLISMSDMWTDVPEVIMAFDVGIEKFRVIPVPNFISNQPCRDCESRRCGHVCLSEVGGHVALIRRIDVQTAKLCIFDDDPSSDKKENITSTSNRNWTEVTMKLPFCWGIDVHRLSFHGIAGTDQLILQSIEVSSCEDRRWLVLLYSYDWKKQNFKKIKINDISSTLHPWEGCPFTPFVESLFTVSSNTPTHTLHLEK